MATVWTISGRATAAASASGTIASQGVIVGSAAATSAAYGNAGQTYSGINGSAAAQSWAQGQFVTKWEMDGWTSLTVTASGWLPAAVYIPPSAGSSDTVWVEILDHNLVRQGPVQFATLNATLYYNAVGSWNILVPYSDFLWNIMMAGDFFVNINWRGLFSFGGKCEKPGYTDSLPGSTGSSTSSGVSTGPFITLSGGDYLALLANRICYPTPGSAWTAQTAAGTDAVSNVHLETAIKHYINNNCSASAPLTNRQIPLLTTATDQARGPLVSYTVKFGTGVDLGLMSVIRNLIANGGAGNALGVSVSRNQAGHNLIADVYVPRNLTGLAWFSKQLGNLTALDFSNTDPTCTDALVQGATTNFVTQEASGTTVWNKTEVFNDSSSETDVNNLKSTASNAILAGAQGPTIAATLTDSPFLTFGRDYYLGDMVTVEVRPGNYYSDIVTSVVLTADPSQTPPITAVPTVGQNMNTTGTDLTLQAQLAARIRQLERKLANK